VSRVVKIKDPATKRPFDWDWSSWCENEGTDLATAEWSAPDGITIEDVPPSIITDNVATVWISGGTAGVPYDVTCAITTESGIEDEWSMTIKIEEQ
jgi:hypothetical protein